MDIAQADREFCVSCLSFFHKDISAPREQNVSSKNPARTIFFEKIYFHNSTREMGKLLMPFRLLLIRSRAMIYRYRKQMLLRFASLRRKTFSLPPSTEWALRAQKSWNWNRLLKCRGFSCFVDDRKFIANLWIIILLENLSRAITQWERQSDSMR